VDQAIKNHSSVMKNNNIAIQPILQNSPTCPVFYPLTLQLSKLLVRPLIIIQNKIITWDNTPLFVKYVFTFKIFELDFH
jgi:hypothetical protein